MKRPHKPLLAALAFSAVALAHSIAYAGCPVPLPSQTPPVHSFTPFHIETCAMVLPRLLIDPADYRQRMAKFQSQAWPAGTTDETKQARWAASVVNESLPYTDTEQLIAQAGWVLRVRALPANYFQADPQGGPQRMAFLQILEALKGKPALIPRSGAARNPSHPALVGSPFPQDLISSPLGVLVAPPTGAALTDPQIAHTPHTAQALPLRMHAQARERLHLKDAPRVGCDSLTPFVEGAEYLLILDAQGFSQNIGNAAATCGAPRVERIVHSAQTPDPWYAWVKAQIAANKQTAQPASSGTDPEKAATHLPPMLYNYQPRARSTTGEPYPAASRNAAADCSHHFWRLSMVQADGSPVWGLLCLGGENDSRSNWVRWFTANGTRYDSPVHIEPTVYGGDVHIHMRTSPPYGVQTLRVGIRDWDKRWPEARKQMRTNAQGAHTPSASSVAAALWLQGGLDGSIPNPGLIHPNCFGHDEKLGPATDCQTLVTLTPYDSATLQRCGFADANNSNHWRNLNYLNLKKALELMQQNLSRASLHRHNTSAEVFALAQEVMQTYFNEVRTDCSLHASLLDTPVTSVPAAMAQHLRQARFILRVRATDEPPVLRNLQGQLIAPSPEFSKQFTSLKVLEVLHQTLGASSSEAPAPSQRLPASGAMPHSLGSLTALNYFTDLGLAPTHPDYGEYYIAYGQRAPPPEGKSPPPRTHHLPMPLSSHAQTEQGKAFDEQAFVVGDEYLIVLQHAAEHGSLGMNDLYNPKAAGLPVRERISGTQDPWLVWVKAALKAQKTEPSIKK